MYIGVADMKVLLLNDDGIHCEGLHVLYRSIRDFCEVLVLTPEEPRSATGHGITLHKPLRINKYVLNDMVIYGTNGTPSDAIHLAINVMEFNPDLIMSGVNVGDNTSIQNILYSGTLSAAIEGALLGIPGVAFSADVSSCSDFNDERLSEIIKIVTRSVLQFTKEVGFPKGVDVLSINIPSINKFKGCVKVTRAAKLRFKQYVEKRIDPRGKPYYWLYGETLMGEEGTDIYTVHVEGCISITPLRVDLNVQGGISEGFYEFIKFLEKNVGKVRLY
ncbi:MAG: 5'/3'-nucleotidase SurE [Desulfurococcales archaeon ex4484_42]|nr:MAG: 5'/3'-nucleotidase SurE [Desulfurococcales archaeon ex4484_42]